MIGHDPRTLDLGRKFTCAALLLTLTGGCSPGESSPESAGAAGSGASGRPPAGNAGSTPAGAGGTAAGSSSAGAGGSRYRTGEPRAAAVEARRPAGGTGGTPPSTMGVQTDPGTEGDGTVRAAPPYDLQPEVTRAARRRAPGSAPGPDHLHANRHLHRLGHVDVPVLGLRAGPVSTGPRRRRS